MISKRFVIVDQETAIELGVVDVDWYDEDRHFLLDTSVTPPRKVGVDGGEPEDNRFSRDWRWVVHELNRVADEKAALAPKENEDA